MKFKKGCVDKIFENQIKRNKSLKEQEIARYFPMVGFTIEIILELLGIFLIYFVINQLAYVIVGKDFNNDFLYALVFLPIISVVQDIPRIAQSIFVRVAVCDDYIICKTGFIRKFIDKLYLKNVDNIEIHTTIWGEWFNYGAITLYSFGGSIHLPFLKNPYKVYAVLKRKIHK